MCPRYSVADRHPYHTSFPAGSSSPGAVISMWTLLKSGSSGSPAWLQIIPFGSVFIRISWPSSTISAERLELDEPREQIDHRITVTRRDTMRGQVGASKLPHSAAVEPGQRGGCRLLRGQNDHMVPRRRFARLEDAVLPLLR